MNVCVIGAGYVGLVSGACFADLGWHVTCVDKDQKKVDQLHEGIMPIYEPGLDKLVLKNVAAGRLNFSTDLSSAVANAAIVFIAVGTPMRKSDGHADMSYVQAAVAEFVPYLKDFTVVVTKSTVPVGTCRMINKLIRSLRPGAEVAVCSNPEFLREGSALPDFMQPDRILVGCDSEPAKKQLAKLYRPLTDKGFPLVFVQPESAELAKYAANAFLALKISFINEIADLCEAVGANVTEVADGIGRDTRIGGRFLNPGPGYGGSCFPKDVSAIVRSAREARSPLLLIEQVQRINDERKIDMVRRIEKHLGGSVYGKTIAVLGVTFKPDTDDMREAPSLVIVPTLVERGADVRLRDPQGKLHGKSLLPDEIIWCESALEAARDADAVVVLTEWDEFKKLDLEKLAQVMRGDLLVDLRNVFDGRAATAAELDYHSIGRTSMKYKRRPMPQAGRRRGEVEVSVTSRTTNGAI